MTLPPEHGARFEITREASSERGATYAIAVIEAERRYEARATIAASSLDTQWTPEPPRWIADTANGFLKTLQKNHVADASWPARLVRWRAERE
jgi:hypothetical protein